MSVGAASLVPSPPLPTQSLMGNPYLASVKGQSQVVIPSFTLESGDTLKDVPVAYKTWGCLNLTRDNVIVICHAFTGSADVQEWWAPLIGPGHAFDTNVFFVFCANVLGSPYGTASPVTLDPDTGEPYGPHFPPTTIRDDVALHKLVLDSLGVSRIEYAIGGSMGGMQVLEWGFLGPDYVSHMIPIATSARHSAWCISWGEAQRQSIYSDPNYNAGHYTLQDPPSLGLGAARMAALLTYRSSTSFTSRFGRNTMCCAPPQAKDPASPIDPASPKRQAAHSHHNEGIPVSKLRLAQPPSAPPPMAFAQTPPLEPGGLPPPCADPSCVAPGRPTPSHAAASPSPVALDLSQMREAGRSGPAVFCAQSYLRYQRAKFVSRFDANCYIAITRKLDSHDICRGRGPTLEAVCKRLPQPTLVIGIESDGLFTFEEQKELAAALPSATLARILSPDGHDGFLLEFKQISAHISAFIREWTPHLGSLPVPLSQCGEAKALMKTVGLPAGRPAEAAERVSLDVMNW